LPELPIQYADYACWQRRRVEEPLLDDQIAFWKRQLELPLPALELPSDRPRPPHPSDRGAVAYAAFPATLRDQLIALSRREGATLFMTLLAAFAVLLHRYSAQDDIVVGSPTAGRNRAELEALIGVFVNTLALRIRLGAKLPFGELLQRVRSVALGAYAHQERPFEQLLEA